MMKSILILLAIVSVPSLASGPLDDQYSYKGFVVGVISAKTQPVFSDQVENELVSLLQANPRFEFLEKNQEIFKEGLKKLSLKAFHPVSPEKLKALDSLFKEQYVNGTRAVILGEVIKKEDLDYEVALTLAITATGEFIATESASVINPRVLESFGIAAREAMNELVKKIPFDASVVKRDGYLVVLDRGARVFRPGTQVSVFTTELRDGKLILEETGLIGITQAEENLTFGKVMVEKRPHEVARGNKVQFSDSPPMEVAQLLDASENREPASLWGNEFEVTKGKLGIVSLDLGPSLVSFNNTQSTGIEQSANRFSVMGAFGGELWLTSKYYLNLGFNYGASSLVNSNVAGTEAVGLSVSSFRALVGYRLNLFAPSSGPIIYFRAGYGTQSFSIAAETEPMIFVSTSYSGPMISGGVGVPLNDKLGLGIDISSLVLTSVSESPIKNGPNHSNVAAWTVQFRGSYNLQKDLDIVGKLYFQRFGSEFSSGSASSKVSTSTVASSSQSTKGLMLGLTYYY